MVVDVKATRLSVIYTKKIFTKEKDVNIITVKDVEDTISKFLKGELPETFEDYFVWRYYAYRTNVDRRQELPVICDEYERFLNLFVTQTGFFESAERIAYPNGDVSKIEGVTDARYEMTYQTVLYYIPNTLRPFVFNIAIGMKEGSISELYDKLNELFKSYSGVDLKYIEHPEIVDFLKESVKSFNTSSKNFNKTKYVLKMVGNETFKLVEDDSDVVEIPSKITWSHGKVKQEKRHLMDYPNKYLSNSLLDYAVSNHIINTWEYKFYLDILSKPKPRKLSQRQSEMYKKINAKIQYEL